MGSAWPLRLLLLLGLLLPGSMARSTPATAAQSGIGEMYLALGDSLGVGLLASAPERRGYVVQFHAFLEQRAGHPVQLRNVSVSGETSGSLIAKGQLQAAEQAIKEAQGRNWRVSPITIEIGGNDILALRAGTDQERETGLASFRTNITQIFDRMIAATTRDGVRESDILTMSIYNPYGGDPRIAHSDAWWIARFNAVLTEEAGKRAIPVAKVYERFAGHEQELSWVPIDFHANNRGHRVIAEAFWAISGYDTSAPTAEIVDPTGQTLTRLVPTIKVRAADDIGVNDVTLAIDDRPLPPPYYIANLALWIGYWDARTASPGQHRLTVTVSDAAGNRTTRDLTLTR